MPKFIVSIQIKMLVFKDYEIEAENKDEAESLYYEGTLVSEGSKQMDMDILYVEEIKNG